MTPEQLDRLEQLAREAQEAVSGLGWVQPADLYPEWELEAAQLVAALSPAVVSELVAAARLGAAWQAAEEALPEGAWLEIEGPHDAPDTGKYGVEAFEWTRGKIIRIAKVMDTPSAALLALAEKLRERP